MDGSRCTKDGGGEDDDIVAKWWCDNTVGLVFLLVLVGMVALSPRRIHRLASHNRWFRVVVVVVGRIKPVGWDDPHDKQQQQLQQEEYGR
jgi:hypothetical protein